MLCLLSITKKKYVYKIIRVDEGGALKNSSDTTDIFVKIFKLCTETTRVYASWIDGKDEPHHISIHTIFRSTLEDIN